VYGSVRHAIFFLFSLTAESTFGSFILVVAIFLLRTFIRNRPIATSISLVILGACFISDGGDDLRFQIIYGLIVAAVFISVLLRWGVLALVVTAYVYIVAATLPMTLDSSVWYFGRALLAMMVIAAIAIYGFFVAVGDKPMFGRALLEE
jgi:hypothetical protein